MYVGAQYVSMWFQTTRLQKRQTGSRWYFSLSCPSVILTWLFSVCQFSFFQKFFKFVVDTPEGYRGGLPPCWSTPSSSWHRSSAASSSHLSSASSRGPPSFPSSSLGNRSSRGTCVSYHRVRQSPPWLCALLVVLCFLTCVPHHRSQNFLLGRLETLSILVCPTPRFLSPGFLHSCFNLLISP